ncbi:MAG: hypothetical protein QN152_09285 [Armatimonadota bacterium]|nr:hypothetical protein [Armatimonadota bacterium]MDR7427782.1 hypothetical protein [Armatimonadota bacterium]MDR7464029.1 hypothetical protein [Armatimonadota bacterium]MDR7468914.1 hypothetical protein [Armatimonadota bacterium]MDR7474845.1 hypothetical protein [Armatimonadota bacterium]
MARLLAAVTVMGVAVLGLASAGYAPYHTQQYPPAAAADVKGQVTTAVAHAGFAAAATTFGGAQQHLGHALNCIEGKNGKNFNASWGHPCEGQGNGILNDLRGVVGSGALMPLAQSADSLATSGVRSNDLTAARLAARGVEALLRLVAENLK